jgi:uncharacterized protein (TIGR03000 family)
MQRNWLARLGCAALFVGLALAFVPSAQAQRGMRGVGRGYVGQGSSYYGYYPYSGWNLGYGYGSYPGAYTYYGGPAYGTWTPGANYYPAPNYSMSPGNFSQPATAAQGNVPNANPMPATGQTGVQTQSMYQPSAGTALIVVRLPADAKLLIDDLPTTETGPVRQFVTPGALDPGKPYHYTLKAQWTENGQPVTRERKAEFQAGGQVNVDFMSGTEK